MSRDPRGFTPSILLPLIASPIGNNTVITSSIQIKIHAGFLYILLIPLYNTNMHRLFRFYPGINGK